MPKERLQTSVLQFHQKLLSHLRRGVIPAGAMTIILAGVIGILAGFGAVLFTRLIELVREYTLAPVIHQAAENPVWNIALCFVPALGLFAVAWFTRKFAAEAQGHGVPEVIVAIARHDGVIRPRVSLVKIIASGVCIGTGGSVGREGPIVQIGSSLGSMAAQFFKLSARNIKVLVAAGAAAGISATFHAPLAGVIFASEIVLGSFAVESLTAIVVSSVLADVVQQHYGEHGFEVVFPQLTYQFLGAWEQLPSYLFLGLLCGVAAVSFTKLVYYTEDKSQKWIPKWWLRSLVCGLLVGLAGVGFQLASESGSHPPIESKTMADENLDPPLFGVGYDLVGHTLHLEIEGKQKVEEKKPKETRLRALGLDKIVNLSRDDLLTEFWWLLPLFLLKPLLTSLTLGGGGSGGIFAPSIFIGATLGGCFGILCNLLIPSWSANPGVYAIVGMGAAVAGTTHGVLSAILIVYELTNDYHIILPIMVASGIASIIARRIDPDSIYTKKLSRRGEKITRGHEMHYLEHVKVRDVMIREFPTVKHSDNVNKIIAVARENSHIESLPVMDEDGKLIGIIRPEDLHRILDSDISPELLNAEDIALASPISVDPDQNLLEAIRDFGTRDVETLPVETGEGKSRRLIGILMRSDVMRRYREELLNH